MKDLSRDEIEHQILQEQLKGIIIQMNANFEVVNISLETMKKTTEKTLDQTELTNGRVSDLEDDTDIIRLLRKRKYLLFLIMIGVFKVYEMIDLESIFNKLISFFV